MHEFSRTQKLIDLAIKKSNSKRIVRVKFLIGPFSEEREESVRFYWKDLAKGSPGEGAELQFEHIPVDRKCFDCSGAFSIGETEEISLCKYCFREHLNSRNEDEIRIHSVETQ